MSAARARRLAAFALLLAGLPFFFACEQRTARILRARDKLVLPSGDSGVFRTGDVDASATAHRPSSHTTKEWTFPNGSRAIVLAPDGDVARPVVIALHGRGEAVKGAALGAYGWPRDYKLLDAMNRLLSPPLTEKDLYGLVTPDHLAALNAKLAQEGYDGVIVVCPYLPDLDPRSPAELDGYADFVTSVLLPRIEAETFADMHRVGIDGVSLGGAVALYVGFARPQSFSKVGAIQPAIQRADAELWLERAKRARTVNSKLSLRLVTSEGDYFREGVNALSLGLTRLAIEHGYFDLPGPHDYVFNQGPGAYELLFFHAFR